MSGFESVPLRVPYDLVVVSRGGEKTWRVDDVVEVPVPVVPADEAPVVLTMVDDGGYEVAYRAKDGRIYRPFPSGGTNTALSLDAARSRPPFIGLSLKHVCNRVPSTANGSVFRPCRSLEGEFVVSTPVFPSASRRRPPKAIVKDGKDEAFSAAMPLQDRMMVVDGVPYHETRLPGYGIVHGLVQVLAPDQDSVRHEYFVDPRHSVDEVRRQFGRGDRNLGSIAVVRPDLIQGSVDVEAAGCFAGFLLEAVSLRRMHEFEVDIVHVCFATVAAAEAATVAAESEPALARFGECVRRLAGMDDAAGSASLNLVRGAKVHLAARAAFPPFDAAIAFDADDMGTISSMRP